MYDVDTHSVRSGNFHTLTIVTPVAQGKEPTDYLVLKNKPSINGVELVGDMSFERLGLGGIEELIAGVGEIPTAPLTEQDLADIVGD